MAEANLYFCDTCEKTFSAEENICPTCAKAAVLAEELRKRPIPLKESERAAIKEVEERRHTLAGLKRVYRKWLCIDDFRRVEANLAVVLSARPDFQGEPIWLINIFPSGEAKTTLMDALFRVNDPQSIVDTRNGTIKLNRMTSKALVSGQKGEWADLAPLLRNRCILIYDYSEILNLRHDEKSELLSQFRELYDGNCGLITGMGVRKLYQGIHTAFIANSTTAIDNQIMQTNLLGTRELFTRGTKLEFNMRKDISIAARRDENIGRIMRDEMYAVTSGFLQRCEPYTGEIPQEVHDRIFELEEYVAIMRAAASLDQNGDLLNEVSIEGPGRLTKQFTRLFICLKSLDAKYTDARAMKIIEWVAESSCDQTRKRTLTALIKHYQKIEGGKGEGDGAQNAHEVAAMLGIGTRTARVQLNILTDLDMVRRFTRQKIVNYGDSDFILTSTFLLNPDHPQIKKRLAESKQAQIEAIEFGQ
jgi:hypothetical protein